MDKKDECKNPCREVAIEPSNINPHRTGYSRTGNYYGGRYDYWSTDYDSKPNKRKHEFSSILLINTTVYDCKHCKRKKEDCKSEYCEDEDSPPDYQNIGDWG